MRLISPLLVFFALMASIGLVHGQTSLPYGDWSSGTSYAINAIVIGSDGGSYIAVAASTNTDPTTGASAWTALSNSNPHMNDTPGDGIDAVPTGTPGAHNYETPSTAPPSSSSSTETVSLINISTRGYVGTGNDVLIAGFVIAGDSTATKRCCISVTGASLGWPTSLNDPELRLFSVAGEIAYNNDWTDNTDSNKSVLAATSLQPSSAKDPVLIMDLSPGSYTAIVSGVGGVSGLAIVGVDDLKQDGGTGSCYIVNISTRGKVGTGDNVMIAGFILDSTSSTTTKQLCISNTGASLGDNPSQNFYTLKDPTINLHLGADVIDTNDNWVDRTDDVATIQAAGLARGDTKESAMVKNLTKNTYTAILTGVGSTSGIGIIGVDVIP